MPPNPLTDPITGRLIPEDLINLKTGQPKNHFEIRSFIQRGSLLALALLYCLYMFMVNEYILLPSKNGYAFVNGRYCILIIVAAISAILALISQYISSKQSVFAWRRLRLIYIALNCLAIGLLFAGIGLSQLKENQFSSEVNTKSWVLIDTSETMRVYANADDIKTVLAGSTDPVLHLFLDYANPQPDDTVVNRLWRSTLITYRIDCAQGVVQVIAQTDYENQFDGINTPSGYSESATPQWLTKQNQSPQMTVDAKNTYANLCKRYPKK